LLRFAVLFLSLSAPVEAKIINAASTVLSDVQSAVRLAGDGDTVRLPAGTATWTTGLNITKAITLQGSGIGATIIKDGVQVRRLVNFTLVRGKVSRMTGIEFQDGGRSKVAFSPNGVIGFRSGGIGRPFPDGSQFRCDHCKFVNLNGAFVVQTCIGVIDHCTVITSYGGFFGIWHTWWGGNNYGDGSWSAPTNFGSGDFVFIEDNTYTCTASQPRGIADAYAGGRYVVRYNVLNNTKVANHGTDSTGRMRSARAMEVYNNTFQNAPNGNIVGNIRGGMGLWHDNTFAWGRRVSILLTCYRMFGTFWGGADGTNGWDVNYPGGPFYSGTASGASSGLTVTVSGSPNWTTNQWVGYSVKRTTNVGNVPGIPFAEINSNTSNTLTYGSGEDFGGGDLTFSNGDSLQINKVQHALDQPGRARGAIFPNVPLKQLRPQRSSNDQVTEPCYSWNNKREGGEAVNFFSPTKLIRENEHYFNNRKMPSYTPYIYPHPLVSGMPAQAGKTAQDR
jgi:hypothetical protein